jgi:hypothetical protein
MGKFTSFDASTTVASPAAPPLADIKEFSKNDFVTGGKALQEFGKGLKLKAERADVTRVQSLQSTALADLSTIVSEIEITAELGAPGHIDQVKDQVNQYYAERQDQAVTEKGKLLLQKQHADVLSHFTRNAVVFQSASVGAKVKNDFLVGLNADKNTLLQKPDKNTFDLIMQNNLAKINNPDGAIANGLDAKVRQALAKDTLEELTKARVQGLIRQNPEEALIALEAGEFDGGLDNEDINPLRREARQAIESIRAADAAQATQVIEAWKKAVQLEQDTLYSELISRKDKDGNAVSLFDLSQKVMNSHFLKPFGVGSRDSFIRAIKLRASGETSADFDRAVREQQDEFLFQITTLQNRDGTPVNVETLRQHILEDKIIDAFGSKGSKNTLLKLLDDKTKGVDTPLSRRQQEIYRMVTTKTNADGQELTDEQVIQTINDDDLLKVAGTAGKKAFRAMVGDISKAQFAITAGVENIDIQKRINLPFDDPKRITSKDLLEPKLIAKVGGFLAATKLKVIADKIKDTRAARLEKLIQEFAGRFKGRITDSIIGSKLDSEGDDRYVSFIEEARELAQAAEDDKDAKTDAFALFNSGAKEYVGLIANKYGKPLKKAIKDTQKGVAGIIVPYIRKGKAGEEDPTKRRPGETATDYLKRRKK